MIIAKDKCEMEKNYLKPEQGAGPGGQFKYPTI
jgi:hypothetical protein